MTKPFAPSLTTWLRRLALLALFAPLLAFAEPAYKLVMQVSDNDPGKWNLALNNANNVQTILGADNVDVEIVVYGPGIHMLKAESVIANRVEDAVKAHTKIVACEMTMKSLKLTKADMNPAISYVPGGVVELIQRQKQGWAYIRP